MNTDMNPEQLMGPPPGMDGHVSVHPLGNYTAPEKSDSSDDETEPPTPIKTPEPSPKVSKQNHHVEMQVQANLKAPEVKVPNVEPPKV
jgi:hypothetical protein